jgi:hypothetical protein
MPRGNTVPSYGYNHFSVPGEPLPAFNFCASAADRPAGLLAPQSSIAIGSAVNAVTGTTGCIMVAAVPAAPLPEMGINPDEFGLSDMPFGAPVVPPEAVAVVPAVPVGRVEVRWSPPGAALAEQPSRIRAATGMNKKVRTPSYARHRTFF